METLTQAPNIASAIEAAQQKYLQEKIHRGRWRSIRASGIDDPCNRRLYYYLTCGELADDVTTDLAAIFEEGKDQEPGVRRYLSELGFEIKNAGVTESYSAHNISASIDGILEWNGEKYIAEIKTVSDYAWDSVYAIQDMQDGYYRKWYGQMQVYLLVFGYEKGLFFLKKKTAKQIRVIQVPLDYEYAEGLLKKAEAVNAAIKTASPPPHIQNPVECRKCPFFAKVCNPPMEFGDGIVNIEDAELAAKLTEREVLAAARAKYEKVDKDIKTRFREIPNAICGDFHISGKERIVKYEAREASESKQWITKIESLNAKDNGRI